MLKWKDIDVKKTGVKLNLKGKAQVHAAQNEPRANATSLNQTEQAIVGEIDWFFRNHTANHTQEIKVLQEQFNKHNNLLRANGHRAQVDQIKSNCDFLMDEVRVKVKRAGKKLQDIIHQKNNFMIQNNLSRQPNVKTKTYQFGSIVIIAFMAIFETVTNSSLLQGSVVGGFQGAVAVAIVVSAINIVCSFLVGSMSMIQLNHNNSGPRTRAKIVISIYALAILHTNLAMGALRSLSESVMTSGTSKASAFNDAGLDAAWPYDNFVDISFASYGLIMVGLIFALISLIDGYKYDDEYPGFGEIGRNEKEAHAELTKVLDDGRKTLDKDKKNAQRKIDALKSKREQANLQLADDRDRLQQEYNEYEKWAIRLNNSGNEMLNLYRDLNVTLRVNKTRPSYFDNEVEFSFPSEAKDMFSILHNDYRNDKEKVIEFNANKELIETEWAQSSGALVTYYKEKLEEFNQYN